MKAKFNEEKSTLKVNGKKFNVISAKSEFKAGDFKDGEWVNNKRYVTFEIEEQPKAPEAPQQPQRKFKAGDKVRIKDGISSETHMDEPPSFRPYMDELIGKELTVKERRSSGHIWVLETIFIFAEEWLEPWSDEKEELKEGDLAIFWNDSDEDKACILIGIFEKSVKYGNRGVGFTMRGNGYPWDKAIKWDGTKKHIETFLKGEITL